MDNGTAAGTLPGMARARHDDLKAAQDIALELSKLISELRYLCGPPTELSISLFGPIEEWIVKVEALATEMYRVVVPLLPELHWANPGTVPFGRWSQLTAHEVVVALTHDIQGHARMGTGLGDSLRSWLKIPISDQLPPPERFADLNARVRSESLEAFRRREAANGGLPGQQHVLPSGALAEKSDQDELPKQGFVLEGEYWRITYEQESASLKNTLGVQYLAQLVQNPNRLISAGELKRGLKTQESSAVFSKEAVAAKEAIELGLQPTIQLTELVTDKEGRAKLKAAAATLEEKIETARLNCRPAEVIVALESDLHEIKSAIQVATPFFGHERTVNDPERSTFVAVKKAIDLVIEKLKEPSGLPALAAHFEEALEFSRPDCQYRPKGIPPAWHIQA